MEDFTPDIALASLGFEYGVPEIAKILDDNRFIASYGEILLKIYAELSGASFPELGGDYTVRTDILCFYPLESVSIDPSSPPGRRKKAAVCAENFLSLSVALSQNQLDFFLINTALLNAAKFENHKIITTHGQFSILIIPPCDFIPAISHVIKKCADAGVYVITASLPEFSRDNPFHDFSRFISVKSVREIPFAAIAAKTPPILAKNIIPAVSLILAGKSSIKYFFINGGGECDSSFEIYPDGSIHPNVTVFDFHSAVEYIPDELQIFEDKISFKLYFSGYDILCVSLSTS